MLVQVTLTATLVYDEDRIGGLDPTLFEELLTPAEPEDPDGVKAVKIHLTDPQPFFGQLR
jgi:hypothetical protein